MHKPILRIYDLDLTITRFPTYMPFLWRAALWSAPWRLLLAPLILFPLAAYPMRLLDRKGLKQALHRLFLGKSRSGDVMEKAAGKFADHMMRSGVHSGVVRQIEEARARGERVMLATASHAFYVRPIADRLNIREVVATGSVWRDGDLTHIVAGENCYGPAKLAMLQGYFAEAGIIPADYRIIFHSDHISDLPVFDLADECVATNPSPALRALAEARGWRIEEW